MASSAKWVRHDRRVCPVNFSKFVEIDRNPTPLLQLVNTHKGFVWGEGGGGHKQNLLLSNKNPSSSAILLLLLLHRLSSVKSRGAPSGRRKVGGGRGVLELPNNCVRFIGTSWTARRHRWRTYHVPLCSRTKSEGKKSRARQVWRA